MAKSNKNAEILSDNDVRETVFAHKGMLIHNYISGRLEIAVKDINSNKIRLATQNEMYEADRVLRDFGLEDVTK